jgi:hypothetical protein
LRQLVPQNQDSTQNSPMQLSVWPEVPTQASESAAQLGSADML